MLTESERNKILVEWNRTAREYPRERCIHELFEEQARLNPGRTALVTQNETLTYAELDKRADTLATALRSEGIRLDALVGICVERTADLVVGVLGILKAGAAYLPIDPTHPADRIAFLLEDSKTPLIVTQRRLLPSLPRTKARTLLFDELAAAPQHLDGNHPSPTASNLAYVIYTSGSTGRPKGVQITHRAVVNFLHSMQRAPGLTLDDVLLAVTTLSFDIAGLELFLPLATGAKIVLAPWEVAADGEALLREIDRHGVTVLQATPATWRLMLEAGWTGTPSLKALCGGEALPTNLAAELIPKTAELWNMYGPTETTIWSACSRITDASEIHIGRPIDNTETYILDSELQPLPIGEPGELLIGGDGLARGYWNRPELTEERFITHPFRDGERLYRTGDLAQFRTDGTINCLGRLDHQVKIRGFRIELSEIETQLVSHPNVRQAVVVAREDSPGEKRLVAYLVARYQPPPDTSELRELLRSRMPEYMVPAAFVILGALPLTPNGKVDRKALPAPGTVATQTQTSSAAPSTDFERRLAHIFERVLGMSVSSVRESFFDLGGHSLLAVKLMNAIEQEFSIRLPLARLFDAPTVEKLALVIEGNQDAETHWDSLVPIAPQKGKPTIFLVHGAGGNVLLYREIAQAIGNEVSIYGFQSQGLDRKTKPLTTIESMAAHYVQELMKFQPIGPYNIAGYCMGGAVAYEMARLIRQENGTVGLVALLDTYNLGPVKQARLEGGIISFLKQKVGFHLDNLTHLKPRELFSYLSEKLRMAGEAGKSRIAARIQKLKAATVGSAEEPGAEVYISAINHKAAWQFAPKPLDARISVFSPKKNYNFYPDPKMGWSELVGPDQLELIVLPANPHAMLVKPCAALLGYELKKRLLTHPKPQA